jgi:SPX domain protein involved in polyphosphate accumulation
MSSEPLPMDLVAREGSGESKNCVEDLTIETSARFKTLLDEIDKAKGIFEGKRRHEFTPNETAAESSICLFQIQVSRVVKYIVSEQIKHEMAAKTLLEDMIKVGTKPHAYFLEKVNDLVVSYKILERYAFDMTKVLSKMAVGTSSQALLKNETEAVNKASAFIVVLSDIYEAIRAATKKEQVGSSSTKWVAPTTFERSTTKYW